MNKGGVAFNVAVRTHNNAFELVDAGKRAFDLTSLFVTAHTPAIPSGGLNLVSASRGHRFDDALRQSLIERINVVGAIPNKSLGFSFRDGLIEGGLNKGKFTWNSKSRVHGALKTRSVSSDHDLHTLAPLALSNLRSLVFANTQMPLLKHSDK